MQTFYTVLIIDDDPLTQESYEALLESEGLSTVAASNGAEAILWLERNTPVLILLDLKMPVMDGRSFLEYRSWQAKLREVPVLLVSGWLDQDETRQMLLQLGADRLLWKPVKQEDLLGTIREMLAKRPASDVSSSPKIPQPRRRQDSRVTFTVPIRVRTGSALEASGRLCDISAGGLGAYLPHRLSRGETITVRLNIKGHSLALTGFVQWTGEEPAAVGCRHGIRFSEKQENSFPLYAYSFLRDDSESSAAERIF